MPKIDPGYQQQIDPQIEQNTKNKTVVENTTNTLWASGGRSPPGKSTAEHLSHGSGGPNHLFRLPRRPRGGESTVIPHSTLPYHCALQACCPKSLEKFHHRPAAHGRGSNPQRTRINKFITETTDTRLINLFGRPGRPAK